MQAPSAGHRSGVAHAEFVVVEQVVGGGIVQRRGGLARHGEQAVGRPRPPRGAGTPPAAVGKPMRAGRRRTAAWRCRQAYQAVRAGVIWKGRPWTR